MKAAGGCQSLELGQEGLTEKEHLSQGLSQEVKEGAALWVSGGKASWVEGAAAVWLRESDETRGMKTGQNFNLLV